MFKTFLKKFKLKKGKIEIGSLGVLASLVLEKVSACSCNLFENLALKFLDVCLFVWFFFSFREMSTWKKLGVK